MSEHKRNGRDDGVKQMYNNLSIYRSAKKHLQYCLKKVLRTSIQSIQRWI